MSHSESRAEAKTPSESHTTMTEIVLPNHANVQGNIMGGRVMHLIDLAAAMAASRHCRRQVVTASVDSLVFLHPIKVGELVLLGANVCRVFRTSMEVEVEVFSEDLRTGARLQTSTAFLTFVALDGDGNPCEAPCLRPRTEADRRRYKGALERRKQRLQGKS